MTALTGLASHREAIWIASAMTSTTPQVSPRTTASPSPCARRPAASSRCASSSSTPRPTTASTTSSPTRCCGSSSTTCGTSPTRRTSAARRSRRSSSGTTRSTRSSRARWWRSSTASAEPVVMLHDYHLYTLPDLVRNARPGRVPAPLHPHPLDPVRRLARASRPHPRGDLRRASGERHHRLPHPLLPPELPAVLPGPDGARGRLRASASCATEREVWVRSYPISVNAPAFEAIAVSPEVLEEDRSCGADGPT